MLAWIRGANKFVPLAGTVAALAGGGRERIRRGPVGKSRENCSGRVIADNAARIEAN